jgi:uncharacterized membrane protein
MLSGMVTSLTCALGKMISSESKSQDNYPGSEELDNKITPKRIIWMFRWALQGLIGGLVVAFICVDMVSKNELSVFVVFALSFIAGSVSWLNFKKSISALKELLEILKFWK